MRRWEYRQRQHAQGAWLRLRRVLADAASAGLLSEQDAGHLLAEGYAAEAVGAEFEPTRIIVFVPEERLRLIAERTPVPLRLGAELLGARHLALVRFH